MYLRNVRYFNNIILIQFSIISYVICLFSIILVIIIPNFDTPPKISYSSVVYTVWVAAARSIFLRNNIIFSKI